MYRLSLALFLLSAPVSAQEELFLYPPALPGPTAGTDVAGTQVTRSSVRVTLDVPGDPIVSCWLDGGLMEKACSLIPEDVTNAGFSGFRPDLASDFHDLRALYVYHLVYLPNPDWRIPLGCVTSVADQGGGLRLVTITDGSDSIEVRCWENLGGLLSRVCSVLEEQDCGTFEGNYGSPNGTLFQIIAWKRIANP